MEIDPKWWEVEPCIKERYNSLPGLLFWVFFFSCTFQKTLFFERDALALVEWFVQHSLKRAATR